MNIILRPFRWFVATPFAHSLRFRLILLVLLATLPSLGLLLITAAQQRDDALAAGQDEARRIARLVAADQSNVSGQVELVLRTMSVLPELRGTAPQSCNSMLQTLTSSSVEPVQSGSDQDLRIDGASFLQVVVVDNEFNAFCAGPAGDDEISAADLTLVNNALDSGGLVMGNLRTSSTGSLVATYAMPLTRDDALGRRAIVATLEVYSLSAFAREVNLPADSFLLVFDDAGMFEQRYPAPDEDESGRSLDGTPVVATTIGIAAPDDEQSEEPVEVDEEGYVFATDDFWTPSPDGGLKLSYALVGFPESIVVERANEKFNENLGKLGIAAIIALVAAWVGSDLFVGRDSETRKRVIRDLYHAFSTGSVNELDEIIGPGYVDRSPTKGQANGIDGLRQNISGFRAAFPQGEIIIRELIADQDKVVARVTLSGTHVSDYFGAPPSGKHVVADGVETFRFMHGMVVESWSMFGEFRQRNQSLEEPPPVVVRGPGLVSRVFRRKQRIVATKAPR